MTSLLREEMPVPMPLGGFRDDHLVPGERQRARHRKADHACPNDKNLHPGRAISRNGVIPGRGEAANPESSKLRQRLLDSGCLATLGSRNDNRQSHNRSGFPP